MPPAQVFDRQPGVRLSEKAHNLRFGESFLHRPTLSVGRTLNLGATQIGGGGGTSPQRREYPAAHLQTRPALRYTTATAAGGLILVPSTSAVPPAPPVSLVAQAPRGYATEER